MHSIFSWLRLNTNFGAVRYQIKQIIKRSHSLHEHIFVVARFMCMEIMKFHCNAFFFILILQKNKRMNNTQMPQKNSKYCCAKNGKIGDFIQRCRRMTDVTKMNLVESAKWDRSIAPMQPLDVLDQPFLEQTITNTCTHKFVRGIINIFRNKPISLSGCCTKRACVRAGHILCVAYFDSVCHIDCSSHQVNRSTE